MMKSVRKNASAFPACSEEKLKNKEVQARINTLALEANEKRYEAYCLEKEALKIMDEKVIFANS